MTALPPPPPVAEIDGTAVGAARFQDEIRAGGRPVVMRGLCADWPAVKAAQMGNAQIADYLLSCGVTRAVTGLMAPPGEGGRFFYNEQLTGFNFTTHSGQLDRFLGELLRLVDEPHPPAMAVQSEVIREVLPGFCPQNPLAILPAVEPRIWIGNRIRVAPHYDLMENVAVCLAGRRRFTLFPPEQLPNLYAGPFEVTPAGTPVSMVDPLAPDLDKYPRYAEAWQYAQQATLEPGDALYLPYAWWHGVEALEPLSILVNYWWNSAPEGSRPGYDALLHAMLAYRHLPEAERKVWRMMFDHYIFGNDDPAAHLPEHTKGIMGPPSPGLFDHMRQMLRQVFSSG